MGVGRYPTLDLLDAASATLPPKEEESTRTLYAAAERCGTKPLEFLETKRRESDRSSGSVRRIQWRW